MDNENVYTIEEIMGVEMPKNWCDLAGKNCPEIDCTKCKAWQEEFKRNQQ